jgi:hypothetical protein
MTWGDEQAITAASGAFYGGVAQLVQRHHQEAENKRIGEANQRLYEQAIAERDRNYEIAQHNFKIANERTAALRQAEETIKKLEWDKKMLAAELAASNAGLETAEELLGLR